MSWFVWSCWQKCPSLFFESLTSLVPRRSPLASRLKVLSHAYQMNVVLFLVAVVEGYARLQWWLHNPGRLTFVTTTITHTTLAFHCISWRIKRLFVNGFCTPWSVRHTRSRRKNPCILSISFFWTIANVVLFQLMRRQGCVRIRNPWRPWLHGALFQRHSIITLDQDAKIRANSALRFCYCEQ